MYILDNIGFMVNSKYSIEPQQKYIASLAPIARVVIGGCEETLRIFIQ